MIAVILIGGLLTADDDSAPITIDLDDRGTIREIDREAGVWRLDLSRPAPGGSEPLPRRLPQIVRTYPADDPQRLPLLLEFEPGAGRMKLHLPGGFADRAPGARHILLETAEKSGLRPDGRMVFCATDATIEGSSARLESDPGHQRVGFWANADDRVRWSHQSQRPGSYDAELTYSLADGRDHAIDLEVAGRTLSSRLSATGSWHRYTTLNFGRLSIDKPGELALVVRCTGKTGAAVMNLKAVTLRPAPEGKPIVQKDDGTVTCHARDVTIRGVQVQYEPKPEKNTVGYWTNPRDRVEWEFTLKTPGRFAVEILQGCGKGQGGSDVEMTVGGQELRFVVEDTGHFQNFVARRIGTVELKTPGPMLLEVRPRRKAGVAVMDLRQVRLVPLSGAVP